MCLCAHVCVVFRYIATDITSDIQQYDWTIESNIDPFDDYSVVHMLLLLLLWMCRVHDDVNIETVEND